ncbi:MAG: UvrB/UvrC motif-containing protein, partial [Gemmatimonadota bacterium]|nr:UvrB/UvrC motif-containing protein [Gemmatimonadota bacterium]
NREEFVKILEDEMARAAEALDFEKAALLRDQIFELKATR